MRRNVVVGFFDTLYWARRFRRYKEQKQQGRMTAIPQFTVPEIFIDDEDITDAQRGQQSAGGSPMFSPQDLYAFDRRGPENRASSPPDVDRLDTSPARSRANSIQQTPQGSPTRANFSTTSPFAASSAEGGDWQFANALSRPPSPLEPDPGGAAASRSRANSAVSAADVLEVLDNSAWGESIRRSFTQRRRD